jgi:hypothetical protein
VPEKVKPKRQKTKDKRQKTENKILSVLSLSHGIQSSENMMFSRGEEAPGMAHADPTRRWRLG